MSLYAFKTFTPGTNTVTGILPEYGDADIGFEFSDVGSLKLNYPKRGIGFSNIDVQYVEVGTFLDGVELDNGRYIMNVTQTDRVQEDESVSFSGRSLAWLFSKALVYSGDGSTTLATDQQFLNSTPGTIIRTLFSQNSTRGGVLSGFTWTTFSNTTDSNGVAWADTFGNITYKVGTDYLSILRNMVDNGIVEFKIVGRDIRVYNAGTMGVDRTTGANPVIIREGLDINEAPVTTTNEGIASHNLIQGDDNVLVEVANASTATTWGRWENYISQGGVKDATTLAVLAQQELDLSAQVRTSLTHKLVVDGVRFAPVTDYTVSDYIFSDTSGTPQRYRIRQLVITVDKNGLRSASIVLNDKFLEAEVALARKVNGILGGATVTGTSSTPNETPGKDLTTPKAPTTVTAVSSAYTERGGQTFAQVTVSWAAVTLNTDNSSIDDLDHYEVRVQLNVASYAAPANIPSAIQTVAAGTTTAYIGGFPPSANLFASVRAADSNGHFSAWTNSATISLASDSAPPNAPSTPTVTSQFQGVRVTWNGLDSAGAAMPADWSYVDVHVSSTNNFTPNTGTKIDTINSRGGTSAIQSLPGGADLVFGTTYYVKLIAYDTSGNASAASAQGSAVTEQLSDPDLPANLITGAKIAGNAITTRNLTVGAFDANTIPNGNFEDIDASVGRPWLWVSRTVAGAGSIAQMTADTTAAAVIAGNASMKVAVTAANAVELVTERSFPLTPFEIYYIATEIKSSRILAAGNIAVRMLSATTEALLSSSPTVTTIVATAASTTNATYEGQFVVPNGHRFGRLSIYPQLDSGGAYDVWFDDVQLRKIVGTASIANASINAAKIADLAVDNAKIANVSAGKITTGLLQADAKIIAGADALGRRVEVTGSGFYAYDPQPDEAGNVDQSPMVQLGTAAENFLQIYDPVAQATVASIDRDGYISGSTVDSAWDVVIQGIPLLGDLADAEITNEANAYGWLDRLPRGVVALGKFNTAALAFGAERGVSELAFSAVPGRMYRITVTETLVTVDTNAGGGMRVRMTQPAAVSPPGPYNEAATPQYNSPLVMNHQVFNENATSLRFNVIGGSQFFRCNIDGGVSGNGELNAGTVRILVTFNGVTLQGGGSTVVVEDVGIDTPDTDVSNTSAAAGTAPVASSVRTYTKVYNAAWSGSYDSGGSLQTFRGNLMSQGYYGGGVGGNLSGACGFSTQVATDLTGATVKKIEVYLYYNHWYANSGGTAVLGTHNHTSRPATLGGNADQWRVTRWPKPGGKWVLVPSSLWAGFKSGLNRGIRIGPGPTTSSAYYGKADGVGYGRPPKLRVTYTK